MNASETKSTDIMLLLLTSSFSYLQIRIKLYLGDSKVVYAVNGTSSVYVLVYGFSFVVLLVFAVFCFVRHFTSHPSVSETCRINKVEFDFE